MKLPIPFLQSKKEESEYYLALILTDEKTGAVILRVENGNLKKVNSHEAILHAPLDELSLDDLISAVDKSISRAEEVLPPDIQTHQTIFGVQERWVDEETKKITKENLEKLKKVCDALDLTPIGFMVTTEAILHLMQDEEGAPVSAVFAEISKKEVTVSLLRGGKVIESFSGPHLGSTPATVDKLLGHFTVPVLPARIVIFQSKPSEHTSQAFITHHWSKNLPFMHVPQVTVIPSGFDMRSVMYGAASQMGFTVVEGKHYVLPEIPARVIKEELAEAADEDQFASESLSEPTEEPPIDLGKSAEAEEADSAAESDFGFVLDRDIPERKSLEPETETHEEAFEPQIHHKVHDEALAEDEEREYDSRQRRSAGEKKLPFLAALSALKIPKNIKMPAISGLFSKLSGKNTPYKIIIPVAIVIIVIVGVILFYYYKMQANVTLTMKPNMVSQDETVTFSIAEPNDFGNNLVAAKSISTSIAGQVSTPATGKKDVGDKAKGTVTVFNNTSSSVSISSGTQLTASNGQVFTLDNSITVASASGDIFSGTKPGTTDTTVTAKDMGTDGNEPSGTEFNIGSGNNVAAKNDNAFSGGTSKTVTVVSSNDIAKLRSQLPGSVQSSAKQKLASEISSDETLLPLISSPTLENQKFDHQVGDQASQVSLTASVVYAGIAYANSDLDDYAKSIVKQKYPQDPTVANKSVKETVNDASQRTSQAATATVAIQAGLLPNIDKQDVISNIQKKSLGDAKNSLTALPQVQSVDISFSPPIPLLPLLFPTLPHHISVSITQ